MDRRTTSELEEHHLQGRQVATIGFYLPPHRLSQEEILLHKEDRHDSHSAHVPGRSKRHLLVLVSKTGSTGVSLLVVPVPLPHLVLHLFDLSVPEHRYFLVTGTLTTDGP